MSRTKRHNSPLSESIHFTSPYKRTRQKRHGLQKSADPYIDVY